MPNRFSEGGKGMSGSAYELLAMLMRYVFVLIGALIVWRSFCWLRRDARAYQREMRALPDAGLVGEIVNLTTGEGQPLPREGTIGSSRESDIRVRGRDVMRTHARFEFVEGKGLRVIPARHAFMLMSGQELTRPGFALHGTQLQIGDDVLRVRLFAGLKVPQPMAYPEPDALLGGTSYTEAWEGEEWTPVQGFPAIPDQEEEYVPYAVGTTPQGAPVDPYQGDPAHYEGNYSEDGQMTWQYAYSLEDLRRAMEENASSRQPRDEEGVSYESPLPHRRKRRNRHG